MAELPTRDRLEEEFARKFGKVARRHMREFRDLLGRPPDIANVPEEFWRMVQKESEQSSYLLLLTIFTAAAAYHGWQNKDSRLAAFGWALLQAQAFGMQWAESTRDRLEKGIAKILQEADGRTIVDGIAIDRVIDRVIDDRMPPPVVTPTKEVSDAIDDLLEKTFGPERVEVNSIDEVTRGQFAGSEAAVEATEGLGEFDKWRTQKDQKVCPTCSPNDGVNRENWPPKFAEGPPIHPRCRCWIQYESEQVQ